MRKSSWIKALPLPTAFFILSIPAKAIGTQSINDLIKKAEELSESLDSKHLLDMLVSGLFSAISDLSSSFTLCFCLLTAGIVFSALKESFNEGESIFEFISCCIMVIAVSAPLTVCIDKASGYIESMCAFMLSLIPTMIMLYSACGSTVTAAFSSALLPFTVSSIQTVSCAVVLPLIKSACTLTTVNAICKKTNFTSFISLIKSACLWITGLCFTLFTGILSLKSQLGSGADTLTLKGLKYGASRFIPIAGGMVSESMGTVITSVSLIKSVTGISGILVILYALIPPVTVCLATKFCFTALSCYAKSTCQETAASLLDSLCGIINILLALVIGCAVSLMVVLAIFIKTKISV